MNALEKEKMKLYMREYRRKGGIRDQRTAEIKRMAAEISPALEAVQSARAAQVKSDTERLRAWKASHREHVRNYNREFNKRRRSSDPSLVLIDRARSKAYKRFQRTTLSDKYVAQVAAAGTSLHPSQIPKPVLRLQRQILKIKRLCRNQKTSTTSATNSSTPSNGSKPTPAAQTRSKR